MDNSIKERESKAVAEGCWPTIQELQRRKDQRRNQHKADEQLRVAAERSA